MGGIKKKTDSSPRTLLKRHWGLNEKRYRTRLLDRLRFERPRFWWQERNLVQKALIILSVLVLVTIGGMYGIAQWYITRHAGEPLQLGATFIPEYADKLGVEPRATMQAMIDELGVRNFRLVSYWEVGEPSQGHYDFSELDWEFQKAESVGAKISLSLGLRQPRWPECHMPDWAASLPKSEWEPQLKSYIAVVVDRYKNSPSLDSYQLENEYFLKVFGKCTDFDRQRLVDEYNLVKQHDSSHTLIVSMSNNAIGTPLGAPQPDEYAISVYKRVWDKTITKRYFEYPLPAWYYAFRAGWVELTRHRNSFIHELQAEPWTPDDKTVQEISIAEQNKSLNAQRLHNRFEYGRATGMRKIDLWGAELWYWRKVKLGDSSLWDAAREEFTSSQNPGIY